MRKSSKLSLKALKAVTSGLPKPSTRDPRLLARVIIGTLLLLNVIAALFAFRPWAASAEELEMQIASITKQQIQRKSQIDRLRILATKSETASREGEAFMNQYFLGRRTASSTLVGELLKMAKEAGIQAKEHTFAFEPVEGSDTLNMMTITANYQGSYADLVKYVNQLDRSSHFFIVESLAAAPQQGAAGVLNIAMKVNVFVREDGPLPPQIAQNDGPGGAQ